MTIELEGKAPFFPNGSSTACETWFTVHGGLKDITKTPLIIIHGGPAAGHRCLLSLKDLTDVVIFYDQIGCGRSTNSKQQLPEKEGDQSFWTMDLFCDELNNLITHLGLLERQIDVLGHSRGGMVATEWASRPLNQRAGKLRRLVLSDCAPSTAALRASLTELRGRLSEDSQKALKNCDEAIIYSGKEYMTAITEFSTKFMSLKRPYPCAELLEAFKCVRDSYVNSTVFGPSIFCISGSVQRWAPSISQVSVPTLVIHGSEDQVQDIAIEPFLDRKTGITDVKRVKIAGAAHFPYIEKREEYYQHVREFLGC